MNKLLLSLTIAAACIAPSQARTPVYLDETRPIEERVEDALARMSLEEKVTMLHAQSKFSSPGVPRLGIPEFWCTDGPHGIRPEVMWDEWEQAKWTNDSCVAYPALTALAATWNPDMSLLYGKSIGEDARYRKKDILLGPGVNIYRTPLNGRNFEYMGEDPLLSSRMVVPYIKGVQSNGVAVCVKHFALNNHEANRHTTNVIVDDRTLYEIYLPAFKAAVTEGGAWTVMGSYNLYKNQHGCHNKFLLNDILKGEWKFDGAVVSDWGGTHDTPQAVENGLDMEFGSWTNGLSNGSSNAYDNYYLAMPYLRLLRQGKADVNVLNEKVRRILRLAFRTTMNRQRPFGSFCSPDHYAAARTIGAEGIVLLKNDNNILPVNTDKVRRIAVIGENAVKMMTVGGGSSSLKVQHEISPLDGIRNRFASKAEVVYARGYVGDPTGEYNGVVSGQDLNDPRPFNEILAEAVQLAQSADLVIFVGGLNKSDHQDCEDTDREGLGLPYRQDEVIRALAKANRNLVVVNVSGNAVAMPWADNVPAIIQAWYLGSECGNALADIISGDVNPSGKLPMTFPASLADVGAHAIGDYPGTPRTDGSDIVDCNYSEGIFVGYRWSDKHKTKPLFAFGHGLSYTTFKYGKATISDNRIAPDGKLTVTVPVTNTGKRAGAEVVQLYISDNRASLPRPVKELKDFKKVTLQPGETAQVQFEITPQMLAFFDPDNHQWKAEAGEFTAIVAASAVDIRTSATFRLSNDAVFPASVK